jgi:hypothetical protein
VEVHFDLNNNKLISLFETHEPIKDNDVIEVVIDTDKIHVFDKYGVIV